MHRSITKVNILHDTEATQNTHIMRYCKTCTLSQMTGTVWVHNMQRNTQRQLTQQFTRNRMLCHTLCQAPHLTQHLMIM